MAAVNHSALRFILLLLVTTHVTGIDIFGNWDKGPYGRQTKQYISHPFTSLEEECASARVVVEHCHKDEEGREQYTHCDYKSNFLKPSLRVVKCFYPQDACKESHSKHRKTYAYCADGSTRPTFPNTGSVSWKVTYIYDPKSKYEKESERKGRKKKQTEICGKVWKDDKGNFYRKEKEIHRWRGRYLGYSYSGEPPYFRTNFLIIKANGNETSTMYKGHNEGHCERSQFVGKREIKWRELADDLTSAWFSYHGIDLTGYSIVSRKKLSDDVYQQVWKEKIDIDLFDSTMLWTINYNITSRHAIPVKADWDHNEWGPGGGWHYWKYTFNYQTLSEDGTMAKVPDFCTGS